MKDIFRKTALERISSPDQLDSMLKITTPMSWLGIAAAAFLTAAAAGWGFWGSLERTAEADGVVVYSYHTNTLYSTAYGFVLENLVQAGDEIEQGMTVMRIRIPDGSVVELVSDQRGTIASSLKNQGDEVTPNEEVFRISPPTEQEYSVVCYVDAGTAGEIQEGMESLIYRNRSGEENGGYLKGTVTNIDRCPASDGAKAEVLGTDGYLAEWFSQDPSMTAVTLELPEEAAVSAGELVHARIVLDRQTPISRIFPMAGGN